MSRKKPEAVMGRPRVYPGEGVSVSSYVPERLGRWLARRAKKDGLTRSRMTAEWIIERAKKEGYK